MTNNEELRELWDSRIYQTAMYIQQSTGAGAVLVGIFDAPWMDGADPAAIGMAGKPEMDMFRLARDLRDLATVIEKQAGSLQQGEPFEMVSERTPPVRE